ncbi:MAG: hypothetical protein EB060_05640 [Proteobacteria bacterium]|nr:hypothetical protein [Pseudomonadota bacterium]
MTNKKDSGKKKTGANENTPGQGQLPIAAGNKTAQNKLPGAVTRDASGVMRIFPTVCYMQSHQGTEKMNAELERFILEQEKTSQNISKASIRGGYHSDRKFFDEKNWAVQELKKLITAEALKYLKALWANESTAPLASIPNFKMQLGGWSVILREGDVSVPHLHPRANISGVYYVTSYKPDPKAFKGAGCLVMADPRIRVSMYPVHDQVSTLIVTPNAGTVVMFPSFLEHYVLPFKGPGTRISIAFNLAYSANAINQGN